MANKKNEVQAIALEKDCWCPIKAVAYASHEPFTYLNIWRCRLCHKTEYRDGQV